MSTNRKRKLLRRYDRAMMRSAFVSLIWAVILWRRKLPEGFQMKELVEATGADKGEVSRWFSNPERPNWTLNKFADIAAALNLDIEVTAVERSSGIRFASYGMVAGRSRLIEHGQTETRPPPPEASPSPSPETTTGGNNPMPVAA